MQQTPIKRPLTPENLLSLIDWNQLVYGVFRRTWIIIILLSIGILLGIFIRKKTGKPRYEARCSILYREDRQKQMQSSTGFGVSIQGLGRSTATSLLRRSANLETVISNLNLGMTTEELGWRVQAQSERNSEIILMRVEFMPSEQQAVATANEIVRVGLQNNRNFYSKQAMQMTVQFEQQCDAARTEAAAVKKELVEFQARHQLIEVNADTQAFLNSMNSVNERLHAARIARDSQSMRIKNYKRLIKDMPDEVMQESFEDNPVKRRIANMEVALMEARTRYGPENPRILQMEDSIREMRKTLSDDSFNSSRESVYIRNPAKQEFELEVMRLEAEQGVLVQNVVQIEQQAAKLKEKYKSLPVQQLRLAALHQRQTAAEALVQSLEKNIADARRTADLDLCDFELLEPARTATETQGKLAALLPAVCVLFSLFSGIGLCLILSLADPKLRSPGQITRLYNISCIGTISKSEKEQIPAVFLPVCRNLYHQIQALPSTGNTHVFCILSACPGDGKSTLSFQTARYWTTLGIKTALLDFDSAPNPWIKTDENQAGIESYLSGRASLNEIVSEREGIACLKRIVDTGDLPEQMHGEAMTELMKTLKSSYDCVIMEAPAWLLDESSARMIAQIAGSVIWIAASSRSTRTTLNSAFETLQRTTIRPIGLILNQAPKKNDPIRKKIRAE